MLTLADVAVLIFFLNHIASMIQLPVVIANIAGTLDDEIAALDRSGDLEVEAAHGPSPRGIVGPVRGVWCPDQHAPQRLSPGRPT